MPLVIDASIALSWVYKDEASEEGDALFKRVVREGAVVPALFHFEVANALLQGERRGRTSPAYTADRLSVLAGIGIVTDVRPEAIWTDVVALGRAEMLTGYDASYLELALRLHADLATRDDKLAAAARGRGLTVIP